MMLIRPALREYRTWSTDSRRWDLYEPRPGDIIIATAPKCGTTWMQQIVCSMVFQEAAPRVLSAGLAMDRRTFSRACGEDPPRNGGADPPSLSKITPARGWPAALR